MTAKEKRLDIEEIRAMLDTLTPSELSELLLFVEKINANRKRRERLSSVKVFEGATNE